MKRVIVASTEEDWEWSPFDGRTYCVSGDYKIKRTDDPKTAIKFWYQLQKKDPMNVAISCRTKEQAIDLCKAATEDYIYSLAEKYKCPYKPEWIVDEAARKVADGQKYFHEGEYGDIIHPFGVG